MFGSYRHSEAKINDLGDNLNDGPLKTEKDVLHILRSLNLTDSHTISFSPFFYEAFNVLLMLYTVTNYTKKIFIYC